MMDGQRVKVFLNDYKYEGKLISEDSETYTIIDIKFGKMRIPKARAVLSFIGGER